VHNIGTRRDMSNRVSLARVDDHDRRRKISTVRGLIYESDYAVDSAAVNNILKSQSLVPTAVCLAFIYLSSYLIVALRMLSLTGSPR
jgi:hypothetical protein